MSYHYLVCYQVMVALSIKCGRRVWETKCMNGPGVGISSFVLVSVLVDKIVYVSKILWGLHHFYGLERSHEGSSLAAQGNNLPSMFLPAGMPPLWLGSSAYLKWVSLGSLTKPLTWSVLAEVSVWLRLPGRWLKENYSLCSVGQISGSLNSACRAGKTCSHISVRGGSDSEQEG